MEKHIMGENGISYTLGEDGLYYPDLYLPEETEYPIGKYGMLRKTYLQEHRKGLYLELVFAGKLNEHLHQIDEECNQMMDFKEIIPISALNGDNVDELIKTVKQDLPEGPAIYPEDTITDHPEQFIMAEFIREKILYFTHDEIPHDVAIEIEQWIEDENGLDIMAVIIVNRKSQKGIIIGKQGTMIKKIKDQARRDMKRFAGVPVKLSLFVRVEKDWRNKAQYLKEFGYNQDDYS